MAKLWYTFICAANNKIIVQCHSRCTRTVTSELSVHETCKVIINIFNLRTADFKVYCAICVRSSNFRHQASTRVSQRESTQRRKVELWARNVRVFS